MLFWLHCTRLIVSITLGVVTRSFHIRLIHETAIYPSWVDISSPLIFSSCLFLAYDLKRSILWNMRGTRVMLWHGVSMPVKAFSFCKSIHECLRLWSGLMHFIVKSSNRLLRILRRFCIWLLSWIEVHWFHFLNMDSIFLEVILLCLIFFQFIQVQLIWLCVKLLLSLKFSLRSMLYFRVVIDFRSLFPPVNYRLWTYIFLLILSLIIVPFHWTMELW